MRPIVALASLMFVATPLAAQTPATRRAPGEASRGATSPVITMTELQHDLFVFAADSMRGRSAVTPDARHAADFIAQRLAALGVEPAGDSGYYQAVPLARTGIARASFTVVNGTDSTRIPLSAMVPLPSFGPGAPLPRLEAAGDVVFAGYAMSDPTKQRDDYAALGDLAGKIVVVVQGAPADADSATRARMLGEQSFALRVRGALERKAEAVIVVLQDGALAAQFPALVAEVREGQTTMGPAPALPEQPRQLPMVLMTTPDGAAPLLPSGWPGSTATVPETGMRFRAHVEMSPPTIYSYNVVGKIKGSDPTLATEYVALGAHLDHIGIETPVNGDSVSNGADDDGSGSVTLLAIARALTHGPVKPKRSVLFVWHTAEELGLFGSQWFTTHPTVPLDSVVAQINADMIGRNAADSLYIVGPAAAPNGQSAALGAVIDSVNASLPRPFLWNREWDSPTHPEQIYYRSDHYNYARQGIPIVFLTSGLHADYHEVSDSPDKIDYDKLARVADLLYRSTLAVANSATSVRQTPKM
jgi:hypothetical protein